jgi:hypothetical protein
MDQADHLLSKISYLRQDAKYFMEKAIACASRKALSGQLIKNLTMDLLDLSHKNRGSLRLNN